MKRQFCLGLVVIGSVLIAGQASRISEVLAQVTRPPIKKPVPSKPASKLTQATSAQVQEFEQRAKKTQEEFIKESAELAKELEEAGLFEEAKTVLETVGRIRDDIPGLKEKLQTLKDAALGSNKSSIELDVSKGWGEAVGRVKKGKAFRVDPSGTYKFSAMATLNANGFPTEDLQKDMLPGIRCGALSALIVPVDENNKPGKPLEPIEIGEGRDINPKESGLLFLSVNLPPGHKSTGKIDIIMSGHVVKAK